MKKPHSFWLLLTTLVIVIVAVGLGILLPQGTFSLRNATSVPIPVVYEVGLPDTDLGPESIIDRRSGDVVNISQPVATITGDEAAKFDGQVVVVRGVVQYNFNSGKQTILAFQDHHKGYFKVLIAQKHYPNFLISPDALYAKGSAISIVGKLEWYQGDPTIFATHQNQITIEAAPTK